ncbi:MAG: AAA family ATPase [Peptococcaceae bacterium]|nr:AAA family ATPase [Peptococcaceae bacterium]
MLEKHTEPFRGERQGLSDIYEELESLIGLEQVKKLILEVQAFAEIQKLRREQQLNTEGTVLHCVFKGNPGTGKTTVARIMAKMLKEIGVLEKGHLVEIERADLVGEYIGHTAQKTRDQVKKAMGGVLFIDEAYALARGDQKDFGREAIEVILKAMEDHRDNLVVILAGYPKEIDYFLDSNPGLKSRFPLHIDFPDYSLSDLAAIAEQMYAVRDYRMTQEAKAALKQSLTACISGDSQNHGNARLVRNITEASIRAQAVRLLERTDWQLNKNNLMEITAEDIQQSMKRLAQIEKSTPKENPTRMAGQQKNEMVHQLNQLCNLSNLSNLSNVTQLIEYLQQMPYGEADETKQRFEVI